MSATPGTPGDAPRTTPGAKSRRRSRRRRRDDQVAARLGARSSRLEDHRHRRAQSRNEKIGAVTDIVLDDKGTVAYAVVATGRFLGMRGKLHAVPWGALQTNAAASDFFVLDIDKAKLAKVPGFDDKSWPDFADARWNAENRKHFDGR